jgi:hypothetical protein
LDLAWIADLLSALFVSIISMLAPDLIAVAPFYLCAVAADELFHESI